MRNKGGGALAVPACFEFTCHCVFMTRIDSCLYKPYLVIKRSADIGNLIAVFVIRLPALDRFMVSRVRSRHSVLGDELYLRRSAFDRDLV